MYITGVSKVSSPNFWWLTSVFLKINISIFQPLFVQPFSFFALRATYCQQQLLAELMGNTKFTLRNKFLQQKQKQNNEMHTM